MLDQTNTPLSPAEIDQLEDLLFSDNYVEDSLDYFGIHGLLCAMAVGPGPMTEKDWIDLAFGQPVSAQSLAEYAQVQSFLKRTFQQILNNLNQELPISLPEEVLEDRDAMTNWSIGFVEGFLANEAEWFAKKQDLVAELMLPIMAVSDLFHDDEFAQIKSNRKLMSQLQEQIPEVLTDLYLLFHSEE